MAIYTSGTFPAGGEVGDGGGVVQTVTYMYKDVRSISGNGWNQITSWDAAITPTDSTNKILVSTWLNWAGGDDSYAIGAILYRKIGSGSWTHISDAGGQTGHYGNATEGVYLAAGHQQFNNYGRSCSTGTYLDAPNTTDQVKYTLYVKDGRDNDDVRINRYHYQTNADYMNYAMSGMLMQEISS